MSMKFSALIGLLAILSASADALTWTGGGSSGSWNDPANWGGTALKNNDSVTIVNSTGAELVLANDLSDGITLSGLTITATSPVTLGGNAITLNGGAGAYKVTSGRVTINAPLVLASGTQTFAVGDDGKGNQTTNVVNGVISGVGKVSKDGTGFLEFTAANTYTGATEIHKGFLVARNLNAFGPTNTEVYVDSDCSQSYSRDRFSTLVIEVPEFWNPIRLSKWAQEDIRSYGGHTEVVLPQYPEKSTDRGGTFALFNLNISYTQAKVYSTITGGDLSLRTATHNLYPAYYGLFSYWGTDGVRDIHFYGPITLTGMMYEIITSSFHFHGKITTTLLTGPTFWRRTINLYAANEIGELRMGHVFPITCQAKDVLKGTHITALKSYDGNPSKGKPDDYANVCSIYMNKYSQEIDRVDIFSEMDFTTHPNSPRRFYGLNGNKLKLTMRATGDSEFDWRVENDIGLCWYPKGDYTLNTCSNRPHTTTGAITVSNGTFRVNGGTTFSNVTAIVVADGATFEMNGTTPGAFKSVTRVTVGKDATFKMGRVDAFKTEGLTFDLDEAATVVVPDDAAFDVNAILVDGEGLTVGNYTGADGVTGATKIGQLSGSGTVYTMSAPQSETINATWSAGAGTDTAATTVGNWSTSAVAGQFTSGKINATFASAGHEATVASALFFNSLTFSAANPFDLLAMGDAAQIAIGADGITASAAAVTNTIFAPIRLDGSQTWNVGANHILSVTGGLRQTTAKSTLLTKTGTGTLQLFGRGDAGTYAGRVDVKGTVAASGDDPFGRAVEGVDGTITIDGSQNGALELGTVDNQHTVITKPFRTVGPFSSSRLRFAKNGTGSTPWVYVDFLGTVDFASESRLELNGWHGCLTLAGGGSFLSQIGCFGGKVIVTNKPITISFKNTPATTLTLEFNVASNHVDAITPTSTSQTINFGADWAFYEGTTELLLKYHFGNGHYYGTVVDLKGHPQRIGRLYSSTGIASGTTQSPFALTPTASSQIKSATSATLYVNQTSDGLTIIPFTGMAQLSKEGPATLTMSNVVNTASGSLEVTGGTLELLDTSWKAVTNVTVSATKMDASLVLSNVVHAAQTDAYFTRKGFDVVLNDGDGTAKLVLGTGVQECAQTLTINGRVYGGGRTYGSSQSAASIKDDVHFGGTGILQVLRPNGVTIIFR